MKGFFKNKKVLIIGGTGTIGQGLLKEILKDEPEVVRIFSRDEHKQFLLQQDLKFHKNVRYLIGDIRDAERVVRAMNGIDYVFHVAAMKHVPSCEYNPYEAVQTNILGTQNVIQASLAAGVRKTIFTSTDKSIAPTNTYGATKLMSERLVANAQYNSGNHETTFAAVRFGNVMGSRGSVIPLFISQILKNKQVTITDPTMTRFMMSLIQATSLTMQAMMHAKGGEIFVLKMPVILLSDLADVIAEIMSEKLGFYTEEIERIIIGLRPGEKMYEELMTEEESKTALELPEMFLIPSPFIEKHNYENAKPVYTTGYRSHDLQPLTKKQVRELILETVITDPNFKFNLLAD